MTQKTDIRFAFISMLFAIAISQVAKELGDFFYQGYTLIDNPSAIIHLFLAIIVISSSWIGWQNSKSMDDGEVKDMFSKSFILLVIDLFIVICYFILVKLVSPHDSNFMPDCNLDALLSLFIFILYLIWDISAYVFQVKDANDLKLEFNIKENFHKTIPSIACIILTLITYLSTYYIDNVILIDIILILIFILFRALQASGFFERKALCRRIKLIRLISIVISFVLFLLICISYYDLIIKLVAK